MAKGTKTGGRVNGTPNKLTAELKSILKNVIEKEIRAIPKQLKALEPKDRLDIVIKLLPYVLPKIEPIAEMESEKPIVNFYQKIEEALYKSSSERKNN